jgi:hypothetical protein
MQTDTIRDFTVSYRYRTEGKVQKEMVRAITSRDALTAS